MRHLNAGRKFGRNTSHRRAMFRNLAANLVTHERIETTDAKAKELRRVVERLLTKAIRLGATAYTPQSGLSPAEKAKRLHAHRMVAQFLPRFGVRQDGDKFTKIDLVEKVFVDLAKRYQGRPGGYTRIIKLGPRRGDNAPMVFIEFLDANLARPVGGVAVSAEPATAAAPAAGGVKAELEPTFGWCASRARPVRRSRLRRFVGHWQRHWATRDALSSTRLRAEVQRGSVSPVMRQIASAARVIEVRARQAVSQGAGSRVERSSSAFLPSARASSDWGASRF